MKLQLVNANRGAQWARQGMRVFWRQPLAFTGLFFIFMAALSLCSLVPVVGSFVSLTLIPAATLGLMAAVREVEMGKFPMPTILAVAWRAGQTRRRDMWLLGVLYAFGLIGVMLLSSLIDGGAFARVYLLGGTLDAETLMQAEFQNAMWLSLLLYLPVSALFWHAPALVHWLRAGAEKPVLQPGRLPAQLARVFGVRTDVGADLRRHHVGLVAVVVAAGRRRHRLGGLAAGHADAGGDVLLLDLLQLPRLLHFGQPLRLSTPRVGSYAQARSVRAPGDLNPPA